MAAETNEIMLDHLRGQFFKSSGMSGNKSSQSVRPSSPDETSDSGEETEGDIDEEESICSGDDTQMEPVNRKEKGLDTDAPESEDDAQ